MVADEIILVGLFDFRHLAGHQDLERIDQLHFVGIGNLEFNSRSCNLFAGRLVACETAPLEARSTIFQELKIRRRFGDVPFGVDFTRRGLRQLLCKSIAFRDSRALFKPT
jgi:hypothetical protein